ncbi:hypothetical protein KW94_04140 [Clostridioides difficile]|nr:hypothetical protein KW94_04140 [Clostridioides difficile]
MKLISYLVNIQEKYKLYEQDVLPIKLKEYANKKKYTLKEISKFNYLNKSLYKKGTNLSIDFLTIFTHYNIQGKNYELAFKIELDENENINDYILRYKTYFLNKDIEHILRYIATEDIFIDTSFYDSYNKKIYTTNIFDTAGYIDLEIENVKNNSKESIPIRVLPSSIEYEDYIEMIQDLISIREDIVVNDSSKVGIGNHWATRENNFIACINNIYRHIIQINKNPQSKLSQEKSKVSYNKIKNIGLKTIIEKSIYQHKNKYSTTISIEDFNIYENQIIKYSLIKIKEKIQAYKSRFEINLKNNEDYLIHLKKNLEDIFSNTIENQKCIFEDTINNMICSYENSSSINNIKVKLKLYINLKYFKNEYKPKIDLDYNNTNKFTLKFKSTYLTEYDYDLNFGTFEYYDFKSSTPNISKFKTKIINLKYETTDIRKIIFLYEYISNKNNDFIDIYLVATRKNDTYSNPLLDSNIDISEKFLNFTIECQDILSINSNKVPNYSEEYINIFINNHLDSSSLDREFETIGFIDSLQEKLLTLEEQKLSVNSLDTTMKKIDTLLQLKIMKNIKIKKDLLKPTQIFINNFSYNKVFKELKNLDKKVRFLDSISPDMYFLKTTSNIYENWCLYKIVSVLINDLGWNLTNKENVLISIDKLLKYTNKFDKPSVEIELEHKINNNEKLYLTLIYEGKIYYEKNKYKTPDYQFIFKSNKINEKKVYLDAKYRNYYEQGLTLFTEDINSVAIGKYHIPYMDTSNEAIASYIVHSHKSSIFNTFGGNHIIDNDGYIKEIEVNSGNHSDSIKNNHRFGSFCLVPSQTYNINKFLKLILEYHLDMYDICWNCGEIEDISRKAKTTKGGNIKYYYTCNNCSEFWVKNHCSNNLNHKLIKHIDNYHSIRKDKKDPWYVICPICFNGMNY